MGARVPGAQCDLGLDPTIRSGPSHSTVANVADLRAFGDLEIVEHIVLHHDDVKAVNTEANPDNVAPMKGNGGVIDGGKLSVKLGKLSWNVIRLAKK